MAAVGTAYVDVKADLKGFDDEVEKAGHGLGHKFGTFGKVAGTALLAGFGVAAAAGGAFAKSAVDAASDLNESMSKVGVVFGTAGDAVIEFSKTTASGLGQSQRQALEAAGTFGNLFRALGLTQDVSAGMSTSLVTLASDLASFNNVDPAQALDALRSGLVGETEPLRQFGVNMNDATLRTKALELGLISNIKQALDPATKAQAAYALVMDQTGLAQGDFARTSTGLANQQRILAARFDDIKTKVGQQLLPVMLGLANWASSTLLPLMDKYLPVAIEAVGHAFQWLSTNVLAPIGGVIAALADLVVSHWDQISSVLSTVFGGLAGGIRGILGTLGPLLAKGFGAVVGWVVDHWPEIQHVVETVFDAIGVAVDFVVNTVVPGLVVAFQSTVAWVQDNWYKVEEVFTAVMDGIQIAADKTIGWFQVNWPTFQDTFDQSIDGIKIGWAWLIDTAFPAIAEAAAVVGEAIARFSQGVADRWEDIITATKVLLLPLALMLFGLWTEIKFIWENAGKQILDVVITYFTLIWTMIQNAAQIILGIVDVFLGIFSGDWSRAWDGIKAIVDGVWNSIYTLISGSLELILGVIRVALGLLEGIASVAWEAFKAAAQTVWNGIISWIQGIPGEITSALSTLANLLDQLARDMFNNMKTAASGAWDTFVGWIKELPGKLADAASGMANALVDVGRAVPQGFWNAFKSAWNFLADHSSVSAPSVDVPFLGTIGGWSISLLPHLAAGGLLSGATVFVGGEYAGAASNPEIVSPVSTMREAFRAELARFPAGVGNDGAALPTVHVYLGDELLTDYVDQRVEIATSNVVARARAGVR